MKKAVIVLLIICLMLSFVSCKKEETPDLDTKLPESGRSESGQEEKTEEESDAEPETKPETKPEEERLPGPDEERRGMIPGTAPTPITTPETVMSYEEYFSEERLYEGRMSDEPHGGYRFFIDEKDNEVYRIDYDRYSFYDEMEFREYMNFRAREVFSSPDLYIVFITEDGKQICRSDFRGENVEILVEGENIRGVGGDNATLFYMDNYIMYRMYLPTGQIDKGRNLKSIYEKYGECTRFYAFNNYRAAAYFSNPEALKLEIIELRPIWDLKCWYNFSSGYFSITYEVDGQTIKIQ